MSTASKNDMHALHQLVARELAKAIKNDEDPSKAIANAIKFLKDNGITYLPEPDEGVDPLEDLDEAISNLLPFPIARKG